MNNRKSLVQRNIIFLAVFSIAMGLLEAVVVVYLRQLYYPEGFGFPLKAMARGGFCLEYLREISTIVMIITTSVVAGRATYERFSYFLYCFGIWDIFYYVWLKVLLNWPPSLLTWDVLFLIPVVWVGPVLAPIICAITLIIFSGFILYFQNKGYPVKINLLEWSLMFLGALVIFLTFIWDYSKIIIQGGFLTRFSSLATDYPFQEIITGYVPTTYNWTLFVLGETLILSSLVIFFRRIKSSRIT
ncbi:MAG: hypothetical protein FJ241_01440 [Nitrospira sp.]|nr:hypothetical protein [Nitrospira sp.]